MLVTISICCLLIILSTHYQHQRHYQLLYYRMHTGSSHTSQLVLPVTSPFYFLSHSSTDAADSRYIYACVSLCIKSLWIIRYKNSTHIRTLIMVKSQVWKEINGNGLFLTCMHLSNALSNWLIGLWSNTPSLSK